MWRLCGGHISTLRCRIFSATQPDSENSGKFIWPLIYSRVLFFLKTISATENVCILEVKLEEVNTFVIDIV